MPPVTRSGRGRGRPPLRRRSSPEPASARRVPSPAPVSATDTQAETLREVIAAQQAALVGQQAVLEEFRDTMREMAVAIARLEKRPVGVETPAGTSDPHVVPQPHSVPHTGPQSHFVPHTIPQYPPVPTPLGPHSVPSSHPPQFPTIPIPPPVVDGFELPVPTRPVVPPTAPTGFGQPETVRQAHFVQGQSSCGHVCQHSERWDVARFRKNGGRLFEGSTDPEVALMWLDTARATLEHIGCPSDLWVRVATGAMQLDARVWWDSMHSSRFEGMAIEQITWASFRDIFYEQYFSETVRAAKKMEFLILRQTDDMSVAQYQTRFMRLERFAHDRRTTEGERASQFVSGLRISIRSVVAATCCTTFSEAVTRALQCEAAHVSHQQRRALGWDQQIGPAGQGRGRMRDREQQHHGPPPQRQRIEDDVVAIDRQIQRQPRCRWCRRRHSGECRRVVGACYTCGGAGHRADVCPSGVQQQQQQPPHQQPPYQQAPYQQPQPQYPQQPQYQRPPPQPQRAAPAPLPRQYPPAQPQYDHLRQAAMEEFPPDVEPLADQHEADARQEQRRPA